MALASRDAHRWWALAALIAGVALLLTWVGPAVIRPQGVIRLRVVANSNRLADQEIKLAVRDAVLAELLPGVRHLRSTGAARDWLQTRETHLQSVAAQAARRAGAPAAQPVRVTLGPDTFPMRRLGFVLFPAGSYETLLVRIGAADGHNWWTVLFPPLAFVRVGQDQAVVGPADRVPDPDTAQSPAEAATSSTGASAAAGSTPGSAPGAEVSPPAWRDAFRWLGVAGQATLALQPGRGDILILPDGGADAVPVEMRFFVWDFVRGMQQRIAAGRQTLVGAIP